MIPYLVVAGVLASGLSSAFAEDHLMWPQSDAFYKGQIEQKYRTIEQSTQSSTPNVLPSASVGYNAPPPANYAMPSYPQYPQYPNYGGGYYPAMPMPTYPNTYMPQMGNSLPFGMNNVSGMMPPVPTSFSFPNPANAVNGFGFPGFPSFGNGMFNPFGR